MKRLGYVIVAVLILALPGVAAALQVNAVPFDTRDLVFNPADGHLYASVPGSVPVYGNSVIAIDPATGAVGPSVFVGSEPGKLALSDDGTTLYVALQGAAAVRVVDLSTFTAGLQFSLGNDSFFGPYSAEDMSVQPGHPNVLAVSLMYSGVSPRHAGVAIYDNGVVLPLKTQTHTGSNRIEFSSDSSRIYGYNNETTEFGFRRLLVTASGVTEVDVSGSLIGGFAVDIFYHGGRVYSTSGKVVDPEALVLLGTFPLSESGQTVAADADRVYYLTGGSTSTMLYEFDPTLFTAVLSQPVPGVSGTPRSLVRWGTDGLAFRTEHQVLLLTHIHEPPTCDLELTQTDSMDPVTRGSSYTYNLRVRNLGGSTAAGVVVRNKYPAATSYQYSSSSRGYCSDSSGTVVCQVGSLAPGDSAKVTVYLNALNVGTLQNMAWASTSTLDTNPANNISTETTVVKEIEYADVYSSQTHSPLIGFVGRTLTFTLKVGNSGPDSSGAVGMSQQFSGVPVTFVSATPTMGTCSGGGSYLSCALGALAAGESAQVVVVVVPTAVGNVASYMSAGSASQDPNSSNNYSSDLAEVRLSAETLIASLIELVRSYTLRHGIDKSLVGDLESAGASVAAEDTSAACAPLADFRHRVGKMVGRQLTLSQAIRLDSDAAGIASLLHCSEVALAASVPTRETVGGAFSFRSMARPGDVPQKVALYLPAAAHTRLDVFDVSGRRVKVVQDRDLPAGAHELIWDGRNSNGARVSAGVYFLRLTAGSDRAVTRITVLR